MCTLPGPSDARLEGFPRALAERGMGRRIVDVVKVLCQAMVECSESPNGVLFWINRLGYLPDVAGDLGITRQIVDEGGVHRVE